MTTWSSGLSVGNLAAISRTGAAVDRRHSALAGAALAQAVADLHAERDGLRAEARDWLADGAGARWAELLGADELLADALDEVA